VTKLSLRWKTTILLAFSAVAALMVLVVGANSLRGSASDGSAAPWRPIPSAPIRVDAALTSVWTGEEMLVSGAAGSGDGTLHGAVDVAAAYDPSTDTWRRLDAPPQTEGLCRRSAVWTGEEMLVWGCGLIAFNPETNRWRRLPPAPVGAPGLAVWTGRELIGWGGGCCGDAHSDGSAYDPTRNRWRRLAASPLAASQSPLGAWTGKELLLFVSGLDPDGGPVEGAVRAAAYRPATDTWRRIAPFPTTRQGAEAVWDGHELLVVGGVDSRGKPATAGFAYNPAANSWRPIAPHEAAPEDSAVWAGGQLLLVSGNRLAAYDPGSNRWSLLPNAPLRSRVDTGAVWTGTELLVWGGVIGTPAGTSAPPTYQTDGAAFAPKRSSQGASEGGQ
jgi:hypothetical protein